MANEKYLDNSNYDFYSINLGKIKPFTSSKIIEKKKAKNADDRENFVSCSCFDADFISETNA